MRKIFVYCWLLLLCTGIVMLFWYNEWVYSLPTPVPGNYTAIPMGTRIDLPGFAPAGSGKPVFLHFFNPDCPCSKFNIEHVRSLIKQYGQRVDFKIVLVSSRNYSETAVQERFNLNVPVLHDTALAALCGVYSTPQAVILDSRHTLYYRGNYNRSRYCTDKKTNYAQTTLDALLQHNYTTIFDALALKAYGCRLPGCPK
jgi:hypothetical protein